MSSIYSVDSNYVFMSDFSSSSSELDKSGSSAMSGDGVAGAAVSSCRASRCSNTFRGIFQRRILVQILYTYNRSNQILAGCGLHLLFGDKQQRGGKVDWLNNWGGRGVLHSQAHFDLQAEFKSLSTLMLGLLVLALDPGVGFCPVEYLGVLGSLSIKGKAGFILVVTAGGLLQFTSIGSGVLCFTWTESGMLGAHLWYEYHFWYNQAVTPLLNMVKLLYLERIFFAFST